MKIRVPMVINNVVTVQVVDQPSHLPEPSINLDASELAGRSSTEVCRLVVENNEGLSARFFITMSLNNQGRVECRVTTRKSESKSVTREVVAAWQL
jgi:hypothetical protein